MEIKDLKVGMKFYVWNLGYQSMIAVKEEIPEELRPFFNLYTVEKVNKVTFVANGFKMDKVPSEWHPFNIENMIKTVRMRGKKYLSDVDRDGRLHCTWYVKQYTNFFKTRSEEEVNDIVAAIDMLIDIRLHSNYIEKKKMANHKTLLYVGRRERDWNE